MKRLKLVIFIFFVTGMLVLTVFVRLRNNSLFHEFCRIKVRRSVYREQLWQEQLEVESLLNPAALSEYIDREE